GAHRPGRGGYPTYVFGKQISLNSVQPGDILQFEDVTFEHHNTDGSWYSNSFQHHTAVVASVTVLRGRVLRITILQQNVNGNRTVQTGLIIMGDRKGGTITAFRPQPK